MNTHTQNLTTALYTISAIAFGMVALIASSISIDANYYIAIGTLVGGYAIAVIAVTSYHRAKGIRLSAKSNGRLGAFLTPGILVAALGPVLGRNAFDGPSLTLGLVLAAVVLAIMLYGAWAEKFMARREAA